MEIGQKVRVRRLRHRVPQTVIQKLGQTGEITGFRVVDGLEIAVVVKFDENFATWFYEDELQSAQ